MILSGSLISFLSASFLAIKKPFLKNRYETLFGESVLEIFIFLSAFLFLSVLGTAYFSGKKIEKFVLKIYLFILSTLAAASFWITFLERKNYHNYVYSTYGLDGPSIEAFLSYSLVFVVALLFVHNIALAQELKGGFVSLFIIGLKKVANRTNFIKIVMFLLLVQTLLGTLTVVVNEIEAYARFSHNWYDLRDKVVDLPDLDRRSRFIKKHTEESSVIVHPPQSVSFPIEGNQPLLRYFLYPRLLVSHARFDDYLNSQTDGKSVYMLIIPEWETDDYYPSEEYYAFDMYLLTSDGKEVILKNTLYDQKILYKYGNIDIGIMRI